MIPSVVAYCDEEILVGNSALNCSLENSNILYGDKLYLINHFIRIIEDSKRLLGQTNLSESSISHHKHLWPFRVNAKNVINANYLFKMSALTN